MSSFNVSKYISIYKENKINGIKLPALVKTNAFAASGAGDSSGFSANQSKPWRHREHSYKPVISRET